ncbi:MAG: hypothetical protein KGL39_37455 [Patescibacteria group bacterium]|nr:hypothetical protein [Patescibacteria group bacterium]
MIFDRIRHDEVCNPRSTVAAFIQGGSWGLGFSVEGPRHRPILRLLAGKYQFVVHFSKPVEKMTNEEVRASLVKDGVDVEALHRRTRERLAELRSKL